MTYSFTFHAMGERFLHEIHDVVRNVLVKLRHDNSSPGLRWQSLSLTLRVSKSIETVLWCAV